MFKLDSGNVLLKPSHRKQMMTWLRRTLRMAQHASQFVLEISMQRIGKFYEVRIMAHDSVGTLNCRTKRHDWQDAMRELIRRVTHWLHEQQLRPTMA